MNKLQLLLAALILGMAGIASAAVPIIKISTTESAPSASFSEKKQPADIAATNTIPGSFNALSGNQLAEIIGNNLSVIKLTYRQTVAKVPSFSLPEAGLLLLLVLGFVVMQSGRRRNAAGVIKP